mmetsp:Transcript_26307/g.80950  ORF Transcript_26307/g.80950 Transcript_26307/m.80950 type:complete len:158 (-) Transcript_26307:567-1040(-)
MNKLYQSISNLGTAWVHGEKAHGTLDVSGDAAAAIAQSNEVPKNHRPQRVPRIGKYFRRHIKKPTRRLKPPKGKVIDGRHEQYTLSYTMQLGIQRSVEYAHSALSRVWPQIWLAREAEVCRHCRIASTRRVWRQSRPNFLPKVVTSPQSMLCAILLQ